MPGAKVRFVRLSDVARDWAGSRAVVEMSMAVMWPDGMIWARLAVIVPGPQPASRRERFGFSGVGVSLGVVDRGRGDGFARGGLLLC